MRVLLLILAVAACNSNGRTICVCLPDGGADAPADGCNPFAQTGCQATEKCTWIWDADTVGHIGCAALTGAEVAVGAACVDGRVMPGPMGFDNCVKGAVCIAEECKTICDYQAAAVVSGCSTFENCSIYTGVFEVGDVAAVGVCDAKCDVLDQNMLAGAAACGSTNPTMPDRGCYLSRRLSLASCMPVFDEALASTDRQEPPTVAQFMANSCAPGYQVLMTAATGSTTAICSGLCAAGEISNQTPENDTGRDTAAAKLVTSPAPAVGDGLCVEGKKGSASGGEQNCKFAWPLSMNGQNVEIAPEYLDTLGVCFSFEQYRYDSDGDLMPDTPFPDCKTLPPSGPGPFDSADDFGCMKLANTPNPPVQLHDVRLPAIDTVLAPHRLLRQ